MQAIVGAEDAAIRRGPALLMGDMNTFFYREPRTLVGLAAEKGFEDVMPGRSRTTWGGVFKLDYILARGLVTEGAGVSRDVRSSDHKPLWATFRMPAQ